MRYIDMTLESYENFWNDSSIVTPREGILKRYKSSLKPTDAATITSLPQIYRGGDWKGVSPKALLHELHQGRQWIKSGPVYTR
jgi:hypothetical protein